MTITGIIAEFNPFHNGHKYYAGSGEGNVVMSGNFMQRGEPAIVDKWTRAHGTGRNGADLVIKVPFWSFRRQISLAKELWISWLAWYRFQDGGSSGYQKIADLYTEQGTEMEKFVENLPDSFPILRKPKPCGRICRS